MSSARLRPSSASPMSNAVRARGSLSAEEAQSALATVLKPGRGAHVHIRFIDGGMVSVRPLSRLRIEEYSNHLANSRGAIKFQLEQGVVRSVTGDWGEAARDRFRLNTPVAAIGIKGTDFIVRADLVTTQAAVVSGAKKKNN